MLNMQPRLCCDARTRARSSHARAKRRNWTHVISLKNFGLSSIKDAVSKYNRERARLNPNNLLSSRYTELHETSTQMSNLFSLDLILSHSSLAFRRAETSQTRITLFKLPPAERLKRRSLAVVPSPPAVRRPLFVTASPVSCYLSPVAKMSDKNNTMKLNTE
jgi:hypothetical protein